MIALAFLSQNMGGLLQALQTVKSILSGPTLGVFLLGTCVPFCNKKGAIAGTFVGLVSIHKINYLIYFLSRLQTQIYE